MNLMPNKIISTLELEHSERDSLGRETDNYKLVIIKLKT